MMTLPVEKLLSEIRVTCLVMLRILKKTAAAIDEEEFFHTSDIVQLNGDGSLNIIDRRDNMIKLASVAYVPP